MKNTDHRLSKKKLIDEVMDNFKKILQTVLFVILVVFIFTPAIFWFFNSNLTLMELFKTFWYFAPLSLILGILVIVLDENFNEMF